MSRRLGLAVASAVVSLALAACGSPGEPGAASSGDASGSAGGSPIEVGLVYSKSGPLATYGEQYRQGFTAGLDYATDGTGEVNGRPVEVTESDDAGDPAKAVAAATDLIGKGTKVIAGSTSSGVALQVAPLAQDNKVLFVSGPAAVDAVTGASKYTFRSGRQTYQDVATAGTMIGDVEGKKVTVLAQDSAFGKANIAAVTSILGDQGATVSAVEVPAAATEFTPFASKIKAAKPDLLFVAWAGTNATQMWTTLSQQGVFDVTTVVTGLDIKPTHALFGASATKIDFLSHFFDGAADNEAYQALADGMEKEGGSVDLFTNDGFVAAQMIVHALEASPDDTDAMVGALEGWTFTGPKGEMEIRAEDHALLQPMFTASLEKDGDALTATPEETLDPEQVAPPVTPIQ
ncbi:substrate-binding domain-containing protein [Phycicoccus flavus]|uniref:ABC transporter substrate-binding protein n=1 Tax=Phycicoccus flavus TaxID=2502783 RepID=A0A8T6R6Q9_9MICO|nr:substrate-binding domain-containing protein [Phycicoccus flavus]NHA69432.1 ABC transporter substrate-binding protein [Phycicoccus flavus]